MATDLKTNLLDEIALEGLDGITVNTLWIRLGLRAGFSMILDAKTKAYLWKCVMGLEELEYFQMAKPRPDLIPYNRFDHIEPETRHFLEPEHLPEDIYAVKIVTDEPVKGSCVEYYSRKDVTEVILTERPALDVVMERYGNRLVIVASPEARMRALIGSHNDPNFQLTDLSYCILERIGRARDCGEVAAGNQSLHLFVDSSKTLFYQMKKLRSLAVIKKQRMCAIRKPTNAKVTLSLFHLTRYFKPVINKTHTELVALAKLLADKPEQMDVVIKVKHALRLYDKNFKKVAQSSNQSGERYFEFIDIPWREIHPDATPRDYLLKSGRAEKTIRHIRLLKPVAEIERRLDEVDSSEDEEEDKLVGDVPKVRFRREHDKPYMYQTLELIRDAGSRGLSMNELLKILNTTKLGVRRVCNFLHRLKYLTTVLMNKGRQKEVMYVACENIEDNKILKSVKHESQKFGDITVDEFKAAKHTKYYKKVPGKPAEKKTRVPTSMMDMPEYQLIVEKPTEQKICAIKEELDKLEETSMLPAKPPTQHKIDVIKMLTEDGTFVKVKVEERTMMEPEYQKPDKAVGIKRFGKMITDVHIRRANWIIEVVCAVKVVENFKLIRLLRNRERDMNLTYMMDQKSLKRLVIALVQEKKVRCYNASITMGSRTREFKYLCDPCISQQDPELTRAVEQAKLRYFSVSKEELKKKAKMLSPPKAAEPGKPKVPQTAKESVQKHKQYRLTLLSKATQAMKYNRKAGTRYGLLPKMLRIQAAHLLLWHVCYDTHGHEIVVNTDPDKTSTETSGENAGGGQDSSTDASAKRKLPNDSTDENEIGNLKKQKLDTDKQEEQRMEVEKTSENVERNDDGTVKAAQSTKSDDKPKAGAVDKDEGKNDSAMDLSKKTAEAERQKEEKKVVDVLMEEEKIFTMEPGSTKKGLWPRREPYVYFEEMTWRRYVPPVPLHKGFPKGWCLISDILLNLPVSLFCQLVNVCYDIPGLTDLLNDSQKRLFPLMNLPFQIAQQLLHSKKYIVSFFDLCSYLCEMGLLSFGQEVLKDKDQTFIYIHQNVSLLDTRESQRGYNKTRTPADHVFPVKNYQLTSLTDLNNFWEEMQIIALGSNLGYKSMLHMDVEDTVQHLERNLKEVAKAHTPATVKDDGVIPGDRRGACGFDSGLFVHTTKNWMFSSMSMTSINSKPYNKFKQYAGEIVSERKSVGHPHMIKGKDRLHLSDNPDKPVMIKKVMREHTKGNKGGRGVKKTHRIIRRKEGKLRQKRTIKIPTVPKPKKKPFEKGDDKDRAIYAKRRKQRVIWSAKEDSVLLMCWLACLLMDRNRKVSIVNYRVMRDYIHDTVGEVSHDKTSIACARRLKFVLKNPQTEANLLLFYREANQDSYIEREFVQRVFINTDKDVVLKFRALTDRLLEKFQSLNLQRSALPENLSDLDQYSMDSMCKLHTTKVFQDVASKEDICHDVLRNILHSAVLLQDKQGRTHEMFKLLTQYPDVLLSKVIKELRTDGLFVIQKKQYTKVALSQLQSGLGLRNFKVSQRYMYNYKHRNLSTLFEESADFLDHLCERYLENEGEGQCETLDFQPAGGQAAIIIPLVLQKKLDVTLTLPQELVVVDMEGFYNFPWGRGKNVSQASTKADKSLLEMRRNKKAMEKELAEAAAGVDKPSEVVDDIDIDEEDDSNLGKNASDLKKVEQVKAKSADDYNEVEQVEAMSVDDNEAESVKAKSADDDNEVKQVEAKSAGYNNEVKAKSADDNNEVEQVEDMSVVDNEAESVKAKSADDDNEVKQVEAKSAEDNNEVKAKSADDNNEVEQVEAMSAEDNNEVKAKSADDNNEVKAKSADDNNEVEQVEAMSVDDNESESVKAMLATDNKEVEEVKSKSTDENNEWDSSGRVKGQDKDIRFDTVVSKDGEEITITIKQRPEETESSSKKGFALVGKTIEEIKRNLSCEADDSTAGPSSKMLEYTCTRNGTSTCIVPKQEEADLGVIPEGASGIASRTLLSLRRAEDVSFEDIRVFNAQDNFVVNSCKIKVKLKNTDENKTEERGKTIVKLCGHVDELEAFPEADAAETQSFEEKKRFIEKLKLKKTTMTGIWDELQRLLPFQVSIEKVWSSLQGEGLGKEQLAAYKRVYSHIENQGVMGIRSTELQNHFQSVLPWKEIVTVLQKYAAISLG